MPTSMDSLPVELRLKIYRNLMLLDPIKLTSRKADGNGSVYNFNAYNIQYSRSYIFRASGQLVRVSRLYYREASSVLYGENLFIAGLRDHTLSFVKEPTKLGVQVFRDVANMRFDGLQNLQHRYGLAVLSTLPRLSNLFLYGEFTYFKDNTGAIEKTWDEVIGGALRAGTVVKNNSKIHNAFAALPQAAMDRFEERGTTITCIAKIASGQTQYVCSYSYCMILKMLTSLQDQRVQQTHSSSPLLQIRVEAHSQEAGKGREIDTYIRHRLQEQGVGNRGTREQEIHEMFLSDLRWVFCVLRAFDWLKHGYISQQNG